MSIRLSHLTDGELERELKRLAAGERRSTVDLIRHLAEFGARRLFLPAGFPSLYKYAHAPAPPDAAASDLLTAPPPAAPSPVAAARAWTRPVAQDRYRISFTASAQTFEQLQRARDLLGHAVPTGDYDIIIGRALALLVADLSRKKFAATERPSRCRMPSNLDSRYIPAEVRRIVWERDGGRCAFVAADGRRCEETRSIEFHHLWPWAEGGRATPENIELRCRAHNVYEAEVFYAASRAGRHDDSTRPGPGSPVGWGDGTGVEDDRGERAGTPGAHRVGVSAVAHAP